MDTRQLLRPYFSSLQELGAVIAAGIFVGFSDKPALNQGSADSHRLGHQRNVWRDGSLGFRSVFMYNGVQLEYDVRVSTNFDRTDVPAGVRMSNLKAQTFIFLHEFTHLFHMSHDHNDCQNNLNEETLKLVEEEVDQFVLKLMKEKPDFVSDLVRELIMRPNCFFSFKEAMGSAFHGFYKGEVRALLRTHYRKLDFRNPSHSKLVLTARSMQIEL